MIETGNYGGAAASGGVLLDALGNGVIYYMGTNTSNFTINVRGNSATSLDSVLATNQSVTFAVMVTNGAIGYYPNVFQVDGSTRSVKWAGGTSITSGNANSVDSYTITVMKTGSNTYTILVSQTQYA
jgi:hypothetical protein